MKKILVVLLILAVTAGSTFAEWSVWGWGEFGTRIDLLSADDNEATIGATRYHGWKGWGDNGGFVGLNYNRGDGFQLGFDFLQTGGANVQLSYNGDAFAFQASNKFVNLLTEWGNINGDHRLWGWYKLADGMVHIEAAIDSRDTGWWRSTNVIENTLNNEDMSLQNFGGGGGFAKVDRHNFFLMNFAPMDGLQIGFLLPNAFAHGSTGGGHRFDIAQTGSDWSVVSRAEDVFNNTRIGLQYTGMEGLNISLQAIPNRGMNDVLALYFGATYGVSAQLSAEAQFEGGIGYGDNDVTSGAFAVGINFNDGPLGAYARFGMDFSTVDNYNSLIGIGIGASYVVIPGTLKFQLDTLFHLHDDFEDLAFSIIPQLWIDFFGQGGLDYWGRGTGMIVRYTFAERNGNFDLKQVGDVVDRNAIDIIFRWRF